MGLCCCTLRTLAVPPLRSWALWHIWLCRRLATLSLPIIANDLAHLPEYIGCGIDEVGLGWQAGSGAQSLRPHLGTLAQRAQRAQGLVAGTGRAQGLISLDVLVLIGIGPGEHHPHPLGCPYQIDSYTRIPCTTFLS